MITSSIIQNWLLVMRNFLGKFSYLLAFNDDFHFFLQFFHEATALNLLETLLYHKVRSQAISLVFIVS